MSDVRISISIMWRIFLSNYVIGGNAYPRIYGTFRKVFFKVPDWHPGRVGRVSGNPVHTRNRQQIYHLKN